MTEDDELDRALAGLFHAADQGVHAPVGFETRLFARLEREATRVPDLAFVTWSAAALPWWVRAAGERHVALALLGLGALAAWPAWWLAGGLTAGARGTMLANGMAQAVTALLPALFEPFAAPRVALITAACLAPAIAYASYQLALAAERWARRAAPVLARLA